MPHLSEIGGFMCSLTHERKISFIQTKQISFKILPQFHLCLLAVPFRQMASIYLYTTIPLNLNMD